MKIFDFFKPKQIIEPLVLTDDNKRKDIYQLQKGKTYCVTKEFADYDSIIHKIGETWVFDKITFLPYYSGLSLFVIENGTHSCYRFQAEPQEQQTLLNNFMNYVEIINE